LPPQSGWVSGASGWLVLGASQHQIAAFVGHLDQRTTRRYIHFMPKDKRATVESIPFEF